ncbi:flavodoxin family protein [Clostridium sp. 19966]|uniref:flavodoxin family protein n=1 Tax=Clostridium sp. 19966 TaxID=2768166 RepID=UPI0028DDC264|nr:flavodoxin family protein [Clostridium sp. 19966]MDT8716876.1 flavodoxin family protein [Clostridium sp. 19966]
MKVIAINGSPRKNNNTGILLNKALEGAASKGADTEIIHLYDQDYTGCKSCFACKLKNGKSYGKCVLRDDLKPILEKIEKADALVLGSPIYFGAVTGAMRSFLERFMFQYLIYDANHSSLFTRKLPVAFIYTMNVTEEQLKNSAYNQMIKSIEGPIERIFGSYDDLIVNDTYQFDDYSKYENSLFDEKLKAKVREEDFPISCEKAFNIGANFIK